MSKAILVFDMPKSCVNCICVDLFGEFCKLTHKNIKYKGAKPRWCPLKEVPQKFTKTNRQWYEGYNACIDEILGGNKQ